MGRSYAISKHCQAVHWNQRRVITTMVTAVEKTDSAMKAVLNQLKVPIILKSKQHSALNSKVRFLFVFAPVIVSGKSKSPSLTKIGVEAMSVKVETE